MRKVVAAMLMVLSATASAHSGHADGGLWHGLSHPFVGLDHILAMLAVGLWSAQQRDHLRWQAPAVFLLMLTAGAVIGWQGGALPWLEQGIASSVLLMGLLLIALSRVAPSVALVLFALSALWHGAAHGVEMPAAVSGLHYGIGFVFASAILHGLGFLLVRSLSGRSPAVLISRVLGGGLTVCGGTLLALSF